MDVSTLIDYASIAPIVATLWFIGVVLKQYPNFDNKYIPVTLYVVSMLLVVLSDYGTNGSTPEAIAHYIEKASLIMIASSGSYEAVRGVVSKKNTDQNTNG